MRIDYEAFLLNKCANCNKYSGERSIFGKCQGTKTDIHRCAQESVDKKFEDIKCHLRIKSTPKIKPFVSINGIEIDIENTPDGSIRLGQYRNVRANSPGFDILYTKLNNEALIEAVKNNLVNCSPKSKVIYEGALQNILVPELLKRLAASGHEGN